MRLIPPTEGKVFFEGADLMAMGRRELQNIRSKMQIIFQHPESALNPRMKIYDSLVEPMRIQHIVNGRLEEREKVNELIDLVGLHQEHLNRYPHELSGGQIQRAVLARILSLKPRFIVADEPTSMLDVSVQAQVLNLLKEIQKMFNVAYLFISHDLEVVRWMSDRMAVMYCGNIVEIGPAKEVAENPLHPYTKMLVKAFSHIGRDTETLKTVQQINSVAGDLGAGCNFYPRCPEAGSACKIKPELREVEKGHYVACRQ